MYDVAIVGGGITGLTLAWNLQKNGKNVLLLEKSKNLGGAIQTKSVDGYLLEIGPNTVISCNNLLSMVSDLGLDKELIQSQAVAKKRYLVCPNKMTSNLELKALPTGPIQVIANPLLPVKFFTGLCKEPFIAKTEDQDESVQSFVTRRFGSYIADYLIAPLLSGIWAADTSQLSARSSLSKLWDFEQVDGSIIRGALFRRRSQNQPVQVKKIGKMVSFKGGLQDLVMALGARLGSEIVRTETEVSSIEFVRDGVRLFIRRACQDSFVSARKVVLATDANMTARLLRPHDASLAARIEDIPHAPVGVLHLAVSRSQVKHPLDGFGFLVAPAYKRNVLGVIFSSSIFKERAPCGSLLLTCFSGGMLNPECSDVTNLEVAKMVIADIKELLRISGDVRVLSSNYYSRAIPNYALGHYNLQKAIADSCASKPALYISANWLKGISVANRIDEAVEMANRIMPQ